MGVVVVGWINGSAQDLFDAFHSRRFADYLWSNGRYEESAIEYERTWWLNPKDTFAVLRSIDAYRRSGQYRSALRRLYATWQTLHEMPLSARKRLFQTYVAMASYDSAAQVLATISDVDSAWHAALAVLRGNLDAVPSLLEPCMTASCKKMRVYYEQWIYTRRKQPWVAGILSTAVPGLGKVYLGRHIDAAIAFLMVSGNAWQAWRGFRQEGVQSVRGWVFGSVALGFYLGNIWGSVRAAHQFNRQIDEKLHRNSRRLLLSYP